VTLVFGAKAGRNPVDELSPRPGAPRGGDHAAHQTRLRLQPEQSDGHGQHGAGPAGVRPGAAGPRGGGVLTRPTQSSIPNAPDLRPLVREGRKVICLRTFSKVYGLRVAPRRLRIRYGGHRRAAQPHAAAVQRERDCAGRGDRGAGRRRIHRQMCAGKIAAGLKQLEAGFTARKLEWVPSVANFILVKVGDGARRFDALQPPRRDRAADAVLRHARVAAHHRRHEGAERAGCCLSWMPFCRAGSLIPPSNYLPRPASGGR